MGISKMLMPIFKNHFSKLKINNDGTQIKFQRANRQIQFLFSRRKAWHGLGQILEGYPTSAEALKFAGLDYTVAKRKLFTFDNENEAANEDIEIRIPEIEVSNYFATIRTDNQTVLGVVGKDYEVVQNIDAFSFFDAIVGGDGIQYETAGALDKGEKIFIIAKLPGYIKVGNNDLIEQYLFFFINFTFLQNKFSF